MLHIAAVVGVALLLTRCSSNVVVPTAKQCFGPRYYQPEPFGGLDEDLCLVAKFNSSNTEVLTLTLMSGDTVLGTESLTDRDYSLREKQITLAQFPAPYEYLDNCTLTLQFADALVSDKWAEICPKYQLQCHSKVAKSVDVSYPEPCFLVGDDNSDDISQIVDGNTDFAFKLLSSAALTEQIVTDAFVSPFSITNALIMTMMTASSSTLQEIMNAFELTSDDYDIYDSFDTLVQSLEHITTDNSGVLSHVQNTLWINNEWSSELSSKFLLDFDRFGSIQTCDFKDKSYAETQRIDSSIKTATYGLISKPLAKRNLSANTVMLFTNAIYFKATWQNAFPNVLTETFTDDDKDEVTINMIQTEARNFNVYKDEEVQVIELPFQDDYSTFSFVMVRDTQERYEEQDAEVTIQFEESLTKSSLLKWLRNLAPALDAIQVALPLMEMYNMEDITSSLQAIGITSMFDPKHADMRNLTKQRYQVYETDINRQDYLKVTAQGVEIASVVADGDDGMDDTNQGPVDHADRPFLFFIMDRSVNLILYAGRVTNPKGWSMAKPQPAQTTSSPSHHEGMKHASIGAILGYMLLVTSLVYIAIKWIYNCMVLRLSCLQAVPHLRELRLCKSFCDTKIEEIYQTAPNQARGVNSEKFSHLISNEDDLL